jgi:hypothetical protein
MAYLRDELTLLFRIVVVRVGQEQYAMRPVQATDKGGYFTCFEVDRREFIQAAHGGIEGALGRTERDSKSSCFYFYLN